MDGSNRLDLIAVVTRSDWAAEYRMRDDIFFNEARYRRFDGDVMLEVYGVPCSHDVQVASCPRSPTEVSKGGNTQLRRCKAKPVHSSGPL